MRDKLRQSPPAKFVALCFIFIVILGNIWITYAVVGRQPPEWLHTVFPLLGLATIGGGIWLAAWAKFNMKVEDDTE